MLRLRELRRMLSFYLFLSCLSHTILADVGTASRYSPPYLPTRCNGNDPTQFPFSNFFGAAGDGIWDNGASCGRQYLVRCISPSDPGICRPENSIQITIVDYALKTQSQPGTTIVLSETAFRFIANSTATWINIEFQQV